MAVKKVSFLIEVDTKSGEAQIRRFVNGINKGTVSIQAMNKELQNTGKNLGQTANRTGLASAAVVELGRTVSDANYGITAMANNVSQLSTLFATGVAFNQGQGQGGLMGFLLQMKQVMMGPLGIVLGFQLLITLVERFSMNAKKAVEVVKKTRVETQELLNSNREITKSMRARLGIAKELNDEEAKAAAAAKLATDVERTMLEIRKEDIESRIELYEKLSASGLLDQEGTEKLIRLRTQLNDVNRLLAGMSGDDEVKKQKVDNVVDFFTETYEQAKIRLEALKKMHPEIFDIDATLQASGEAGVNELANSDLAKKAAELVAAQEHADALLFIENNANEARKKSDEEALRHKMMMLDAIGGGLQSLGFLAGEATQEGKAIAAAGALIDTYAAITGILANTAKTPLGGIPGFAVAQAIAAGLFGFAQVKKIYSVQVPGKGGGGGGTQAAGIELPQPQEPDFNIIGSSGINQIGRAVRGQFDKPVRAYITSKDVRTGAELDRNIVDGSIVG